MSIQEIGLGDEVECPHCGREFALKDINDEELDDFDVYFEHITTCRG